MLRFPLATLLAIAPLTAQIGPAPASGKDNVAEQRVAGSVNDQGKPVAGAEVTLTWRKYPLDSGHSALAMMLETRTVKTGADGSFEAMVPPWRWFSVWAKHGERTTKTLDEQRAPAPRLSLELADATRVSGSLRHGGQPATGQTPFRLTLVSPARHLVPLQVTGKTDESGAFEVGGLPAETSWLLQLAGTRWRLPRPVVLEPGKPVESEVVAAIELACAFALPNGSPATGGVQGDVLHLAHTGSFAADASGQAVLRGLFEGAGTTLLLRPTGFATQIMSLEPGLSPRAPAPQAKLTLRPGRDIRGRIVDGKGQPVAGIEVLFVGTVHMTGISVNDISVLAKTDADGNYATNELDPDALYVPTVILPNGEPQQIAIVDPRKHEADLGTFRLGSRRAHVNVQLVELPPMQRYELRLYGPRSMGQMKDWLTLLRADDGTWLAPNVIDGEYALIVINETVGFGRLALTLPPAPPPTPITATIALSRSRDIAGIVVTGDQPAEGQLVMLVPHAGTEDGGSPDWTNMLARILLDEIWPEDKHPRKMVTGKDGRFSLKCFEASSDHDLLVRPDKFERTPPEPVRVEYVNKQSGEIRVSWK